MVAAKILKGSSDIALGDFRGEIEILRRVHHPNAVQARYLDFFHNFFPFIAPSPRGRLGALDT